MNSKKILVSGAVLLASFTLAACGNSNSATESTGSGSGQTTQSANNKITVDYDDYAVGSSKNYKLDYTNNDWDLATVKVNKVTVYKLAKSYTYDSGSDGKFAINGFIKLDVSVTAKDDVDVYATQGTGNFNGQQQSAAGLSWDGSINKGATKSGEIYLPVKDLKKVSDIKEIRYQFSAYPKETSDDFNYDLTLNLNN